MSEAGEIRRGGNAWWILAGIVIGLIVLPFGGLFVWGLFLPDAYEVQVSGRLGVEPEVLFETIADPAQQRDWRPGVTRSEIGAEIAGDPVVVLYTGDTALSLRRTEAVPASEVEWTVVPSRRQVFEGSWTYALSPEAGGTRLVVTERGVLTSPFARAATQALFGLDTYSRATLRALARHHQVEVTIDE